MDMGMNTRLKPTFRKLIGLGHIAFMTLIALGVSTVNSGADTIWTGATSTDFTNPSNWNNGLPTAQPGLINGSETLTIGASTSATAQSLIFQGGGSSTLSIDSTSSLSLAGGSLTSAFYVNDGSTLTLSGGTINDSSGYLQLGDGTGGSGKIIQTASANLNFTGSALTIGSSTGGTGEYDLQSGNLYVNASGSATVGMAGTGKLIQTGGTLTADSAVAIGGGASGTYTISGGSGTFNNGLNLGSQGTVNLNSGGTIIAKGTSGISGGGLIQGNGGTLQASADLTVNVPLHLGSNTRTTMDTNGHNVTLNGTVTDANDGSNGGLTKIGSGDLTFKAGTNSIASLYTLGGNINQGSGVTLTSYEMGIGYSTGNTATYTLTGGTITLPAGTVPPIVGGPSTAASLRVGDFNGTGTFNQSAGTVTDGGSLNIGNRGGTGVYNLTGGQLNLGASTLNVFGRNDPRDGNPTDSNSFYRTLGSSAGTLNLSGGTLSLASAGAIILSSLQTTTLPSIAQGSKGTIVQTGGTLQIQNGGTLYLSGVGTGEYDLNGGLLQVGGSGLAEHFGGTSGTYTFKLGGGTLQVYGSDLTTSASATLVANSTSMIDTNGLNATFSGTLSGVGALLKTGAGNMTLTHDNSYSGGTSVNAGKLLANNATGSAIGSGALTVASGATVGGMGKITPGSFTINGFVQVGNGTDATSTFTLGNTASSSFSNATLQFNLDGTSAQSNHLTLGAGALAFSNTKLQLSFTLPLNGTNALYNLIDNGSSSSGLYSGLTLGGTDVYGNQIIIGGLSIDATGIFGATGTDGQVTTGVGTGSYLFLNTTTGQIGAYVVPEPSTWAMLLSGVVLLAAMQRRRKTVLTEAPLRKVG